VSYPRNFNELSDRDRGENAFRTVRPYFYYQLSLKSLKGLLVTQITAAFTLFMLAIERLHFIFFGSHLND
jgi:hypothetical protein